MTNSNAVEHHVAQLDLEARVKECLQRKAFVLPQQSKHLSAVSCLAAQSAPTYEYPEPLHVL